MIRLPANRALACSRATAVQSDGKIIVVGKIFDKCNYTYLNDPASSRKLYVRRYRSNGSPDTGPWWASPFGVDGFGVEDIGTGISLTGDAFSVLIQSDGKIVVGGRRFSRATGYTAYVWRFNTNGELDTTFGNNETVAWSTTYLNPANVTAMAISQNKLLLGVSTNNSTNIRLGRLNSNGSPDINFGNWAQIITNITPSGKQIGLDASNDLGGVIYVGGKMANWPDGSEPVLARYYPSGVIDLTFGSSGRVWYPTCNPPRHQQFR